MNYEAYLRCCMQYTLLHKKSPTIEQTSGSSCVNKNPKEPKTHDAVCLHLFTPCSWGMQTGFYKYLATKYSTLLPKSTRSTNLLDSNNALHASKNDKSERVLEWCCGIYSQLLLKYVHSHSLTSSKPRASGPSLIYMADGTHRLIRE